jgi:hypothetical protein
VSIRIPISAISYCVPSIVTSLSRSRQSIVEIRLVRLWATLWPFWRARNAEASACVQPFPTNRGDRLRHVVAETSVLCCAMNAATGAPWLPCAVTVK